MCHLSITSGCDKAATKLIAFSSVKTSRNCSLLETFGQLYLRRLTNDQVRIEIIGNRHDDMLKGKHIVRIPHALGGPRDVNIPALPIR